MWKTLYVRTHQKHAFILPLQDNVTTIGPQPFSKQGSYKFILPLPGVVLIHACQKSGKVPSKVG